MVKITSESLTLICQHIALTDNFDVRFVEFCFVFLIFYFKDNVLVQIPPTLLTLLCPFFLTAIGCDCEKGTFYIHNIPHFSTEQLLVACLKRTGHYMHILILRLYKVLKVFLTQVKESLSFIHRCLNIWGIHIFADEKVYPQIYFRA